MQLKATDSSVIFVGDDIEARIMFGNALLNFRKEFSITYFFNAASAADYLATRPEINPEFVFLNAGADIKQCMQDIHTIKDCVKEQDCRIVIYDTCSILTNTIGIFSMGADHFVHKPYDFRGLKRVLPQLMSAKSKEETMGNLRLSLC